ncbi:MAG: RhuM family protein [Bacteroidota bacterium]
MNQGEIVIYQADNTKAKLEVRIEEDTAWLTQNQMVELFGRDRTVITKHINNIFKENELIEKRSVQFLHIPFSDKPVKYYNLDVIISVGYRVKSKQGTQFRIWANKVLKSYLLKGYAVHQQFEQIEKKIKNHDKILFEQNQKLELLIKTALPAREGIFYDGQIFDAWQFVSGLIKDAKQNIILIDNYIDDTVLALLSKRQAEVTATIYTAKVNHQLDIDLKRHNAQYPPIQIISFTKSHDRFLIIDNEVVYHIGASLKDLGKKWFAFSRIKLDAKEMIQQLEQNQ